MIIKNKQIVRKTKWYSSEVLTLTKMEDRELLIWEKKDAEEDICGGKKTDDIWKGRTNEEYCNFTKRWA